MDEQVTGALRDQLKRGDRLAFRIVSGSMVPVIAIGDLIEVERLPPGGVRALKTFDIVLIEQKERLVCHYLAWVNETEDKDGSILCVTRGINSRTEDLPVPDSSLLGKIVSHRIPLKTKLGIAARLMRERFRRRFF
jgi:signal peptidase I